MQKVGHHGTKFKLMSLKSVPHPRVSLCGAGPRFDCGTERDHAESGLFFRFSFWISGSSSSTRQKLHFKHYKSSVSSKLTSLEPGPAPKSAGPGGLCVCLFGGQSIRSRTANPRKNDDGLSFPVPRVRNRRISHC